MSFSLSSKHGAFSYVRSLSAQPIRGGVTGVSSQRELIKGGSIRQPAVMIRVTRIQVPSASDARRASAARRASSPDAKTPPPYPAQVIGSYVFLWGQKQERTHTWFGLLMDTGETTESVDVMQFLWTGDWPVNRSPRVRSISLDGNNNKAGATLEPGQHWVQ